MHAQDEFSPPAKTSVAEPSVPSPPSESKKYSVSGTVVNLVTGEGLARALVEINNQMATMTDGSGRFTFDSMSAGYYFVSARRPGYFEPRELQERAQAFPEGVNVGPNAPAVTIKLVPESIVFGHVTDGDGLPVSRLPVECLRSTVIEGHRLWVQAGNATTDEDGYYRIARLTPGTYRVAAGPSRIPSLGAIAKVGSQMAGYGEASYPAPAEDGSKAGTRIDAGRKVEANLSVRAERFYEVSGLLMGAAGNHAFVHLEAPEGVRGRRGMGAQLMQADSGSFTLRFVPAGDYVLVGNAQIDNLQLQTRMPIHVAGDMSDVRLVLSPAITLPVNFEVQRTKPDSGTIPNTMEVNGRRVPTVPAQVVLRSANMPQQQFAAGPHPPEFTQVAFDNLQPGKYQVAVTAFADLYVASARLGTTDLLQDDLVLSGSPQSPLEVVLRDDGGTITGKITGDYVPQPKYVLVVPEHGAPFINSDNSGNSGMFSIRNLRPGSYSILVFDDVSGLEYGSREVLDSYLTHAAHAEVTASGETTVSVDVIRRGEEGE